MTDRTAGQGSGNAADEYESAFDEFADGLPKAKPGDEPPAAAEGESDAGSEQESQPPVAEEDESRTGDDDDPGSEDSDDPIATAHREAEQWRHKYQSDLGRQAALQRKIQEQQAEIDRLSRQPARAQQGIDIERGASGGQDQASDNPDGSGMSDAEWDALKQDFPEIAKAMESRLGEIARRYESRIDQLEQQLTPIQESQRQSFLASQYATLEARHPDYREVSASEQFRQWLTHQPQQVQALADSDAADDAAWLLDAYKRDFREQNQNTAGDLQQRRQRQLQQGRSVSGRASRGVSGQPPADDYEAAFDFYADQA